ncbi:SGNH/GDSL hydrolase family protein, partial [Streptomyces sp. SID10244]|nr:SGNH/GDSL hydrolase family protein [Streptomyces sp. SID10244]
MLLPLIIAACVGCVGNQPSMTSLRLSVIGDSYTTGSDAGGYGVHNWVETMRENLRTDRGVSVTAQILAVGGSGYVRRGLDHTTFGDRAKQLSPDAQLVIVFGSRNDMEEVDGV